MATKKPELPPSKAKPATKVVSAPTVINPPPEEGDADSLISEDSAFSEPIPLSKRRFSTATPDLLAHRTRRVSVGIPVPLHEVFDTDSGPAQAHRHSLKVEDVPEEKRKSDENDKTKPGHTLEILEGAKILDYEEDKFTDPMVHYEAAHIVLMSQKGKHNAWEEEDNPTEEYLKKKERSRLDKLKRDRGAGLSYTFSLFYHVSVVFIFVYSWMDSFKIIIQEAKLQTYHLQGVYNCMEVVQKVNEVQFFVEILHALASACVLFAETSANACLCMAFIFAQAVHTIYKGFQLFMQFRFLNGDEQGKMGANFLIILLCNLLASIVVLQRYYDLTDRVRTRARMGEVDADGGGSMNDEIIYQNQSTFVRRKYILRQAVALQVYRIIQKIDNCKRKGLKLDKIELYKEIRAATLAVKDVDSVDNNRVMKVLKRANAKRLKEMENDPIIRKLNHEKSFTELFLVTFSDDDLGVRKQTLMDETLDVEHLKKHSTFNT